MALGISLRTDNEENEVNRFILSWNGEPLFEMRYETETRAEDAEDKVRMMMN